MADENEVQAPAEETAAPEAEAPAEETAAEEVEEEAAEGDEAGE